MILSLSNGELRTMVLVRARARQVLASVLTFASDFVGEQVSEKQLIAVIAASSGFVLIFSSIWYIGILLIGLAGYELKG